MGTKRKKNQLDGNGDGSSSGDTSEQHRKRNRSEPNAGGGRGNATQSFDNDAHDYPSGTGDDEIEFEDQYFNEELLMEHGNDEMNKTELQKKLKDQLVDADFYNGKY